MQTRLVRPSPVGDRGRREQVSSHLCCGQLAPRGTARRPATSGSGSGTGDGLPEAADVEAQAVLGGLPEVPNRDHVLLCPVARIMLEAVAWIALAQTSHQA